MSAGGSRSGRKPDEGDAEMVSLDRRILEDSNFGGSEQPVLRGSSNEGRWIEIAKYASGQHSFQTQTHMIVSSI